MWSYLEQGWAPWWPKHRVSVLSSRSLHHWLHHEDCCGTQGVEIGLVRSWSAVCPIQYLRKGCQPSNGQRNLNQNCDICVEYRDMQQPGGPRDVSNVWFISLFFVTDTASMVFLNPQMAAHQSALNWMLCCWCRQTWRKWCLCLADAS